MKHAILIAALWSLCGPSLSCGGKRAIPPRGTYLLDGGTLVFEDDFQRAALGDAWAAKHADWRIVDGWLHSQHVDNAGVWLTSLLPEGAARVEFTVRSEPLKDGSFPGDVKCEIFAETPDHEAGYSVINGGWNNTVDMIARKGEHHKTDFVKKEASRVEASRAYRWAVVRHEGTVYFFRDGELLLRYADPQPVPGRHFGFNNWRTNVFFDDVRVYKL